MVMHLRMYASVCRDATYICVCVCVCLVCTVLYMRIEAYVFFEMPISIYVTVQCALVFAIFINRRTLYHCGTGRRQIKLSLPG